MAMMSALHVKPFQKVWSLRQRLSCCGDWPGFIPNIPRWIEVTL